MENGITEESFFEINKSIYDACEALSEATAKGEPSKEELFNIHGHLSINTSQLLESNGFIQTENPELIEQFKRLFNAAGGYKRYSMATSHNRRVIRDSLENGNDDELYEEANTLKINNAFLRTYIKNLATASKEIKEIEDNKTNKK